MSRLGKQPIALPKGVKAHCAGNKITVEGPKGALHQELMPIIGVVVNEEQIVVELKGNPKRDSKFHGLFRSLIANMVTGVTKGFQKELQMVGVGYRAALKGHALDLQVGLSHPKELHIPKDIQVVVDKGTKIVITGKDKQVVGQFAATVRGVRPPEPYQGKGIRYAEEHVRRKAGKAGGKKGK